MADVFISYSRKDKGFVQRLDEALKQRGRDAWVDWEDIRPTEEFMLAIYAAIEGTDTFIFVLSPDSITSDVCRKEIAHAAAQNKRMVPLVTRDVNAAEVPEPLAKLNWIFCRESDSFEAATDTLISALDTDLDWVRGHTRLLTRAVEWEAQGKNNSFVLRGDDLRAAEQWLTEAGTDKERQPTPLQTAYIIASRKATARRQRITLGAVTFGFVVAIVLAILAYFSRQEAHRRLVGATIAAGQERVDRGDLFDALPYFVEALKLDLGDRLREPLHRVRLGATLRQGPQLMAAYFHQNGSVTAQLSANGEWLLTTADEPTATLRRISTGEERQLKVAERVGGGAFSADGRSVVLYGRKSAPIPGMLTPMRGWEEAGAQVWDVARGVPLSGLLTDVRANATLSLDGRLLATPRGNEAVVLNLQGEQVAAFTHQSVVQTVAFDVQGTQLLATTERKTATVWDLPSGMRRDLPPEAQAWRAWFSHDGTRVLDSSGRIWRLADLSVIVLDLSRDINHAAFSPDDKYVVVGSGSYPITGDGSAQVFDAVTGRATTPLLPHGEDVTSTAFSADGYLVATGSQDGAARIWNAARGFPVTPPLRHLAGVTTVQFAGNPPSLLLTASNDGSVRLWTIGTPKEVTINTPGSAWVGIFNPGGKRIALGGFDESTPNGQAGRSGLGVARVYSIDGQAVGPPLAHRSPPSVAFSLDGHRLITRDWSGNMFIWNEEGRSLAASYVPRAVDSEGRQIVEFGGEGRVWVRDIIHGTTRELPEVGGTNEAVFSLDGKQVALAGPTSAGLWNIATGKHSRYSVDAVSPLRAINLSPQQRWLMLSTYGKSQLLDLKSGTSVGLDFSDANIFSSNDQWLLNVKTGRVMLWDLRNGRTVELSAMGNSKCAAFSPRGDRLIIGYQQNMARLWDPKNQVPLFSPLLHTTAIESVAFSHNGQMVATGASDNQARVWDAATASALTPLLAHTSRTGVIMDVEFSLDGHHLLTVSNDHTSKIWDLSPDDRSADELEALAQFLAARRVDEGGGVVPLNQPDLPKLYERLRKRSSRR